MVVGNAVAGEAMLMTLAKIAVSIKVKDAGRAKTEAGIRAKVRIVVSSVTEIGLGIKAVTMMILQVSLHCLQNGHRVTLRRIQGYGNGSRDNGSQGKPNRAH